MFKMLATGQPQYVEIFVTHVVEDGPLLKIYGQLDRSAAIFIEKLILQYSEQFERGVGAIFPGSLAVNSLCCAKYGGDGVYYRAKIVDVSTIHQGFVRVNFIDYGNSDIVNIANIRSLNGMQSSPLCSVQSQATEFVLAGIVPPMGNAWDEQSVEFIKEKLCYAEFRCAVVAQFSGRKLIKLYYNDVDFAEILVQKNLALHISLQSQQNMLQNFHQYASVPSFSYPVPPPIQQNYPTSANLLVKAAAITKQETGVISAPLLTVGSKHTIYISYVEDGPYLFAIQLKSTENILQNMTKSFSQLMLKPFSQSPIPGSVCVTLLTHSKVLCRAVVTNIMENECMVYCVDFGNTETVQFSQIYEVPPQFLNTKSLAMRFSLAGIQNANFNDKAKRIFQELVMGETLLLEVVEPEGPPLKQYGNIYINGENIVTLLKERLKSFEKPKAYPPLPAIQPGRFVNVTVSFVESVNEFYVQYEANSRALNNIMTTMEQFCANSAAMIRHDEMYIGMPVCALFSVDQQWYRAKVVSASVNEIVVFHVDYGSSDTMSLVSLRHMDPTLLQCQAQAVQCALSGFQDFTGSLDDVSNRLEEMTLERKLTMKILSHMPNGKLLVELHDTTVAPVQNIAEQIKKPAQSHYETPIDEWCDPAAAGEPAAISSRSAPFGGREKSKFEEGSGEGWRSESKKAGGWNESSDGKKWGNRDDRARGDKKWNRNNQATEENQWGKERNDGNDDWDNAEDKSKKFDNSDRTNTERNWANRGEREDNRRGKDNNDWKNKENRRGFNKGVDDWKGEDNRRGFNKDGDSWQERDNRRGGFNEGDDRNDRENRRGFNKGEDWKERDGNRRGFNKDDDWKDKENKRSFNKEGGDWKDRDSGRQGFRDGDNRRGGFNRDGGDRGWKKNEDGNQDGKKWWGHDDRSEPGKWESKGGRQDGDQKWESKGGRQDGDQKWGGRDKRSSSAGDFKKWNEGGNQRGGGGRDGGNSWKGSAASGGGGGGDEWDSNNQVESSVTTVDSWDASDALSGSTVMGDKNKLVYPEPVVTLGSKLKVTLVSAEDPTNFVLQIDDKIPDVTKIMEEVAAIYESGGNVIPETDQKVTTACIARYPLDEVWYRAVITKAPISSVTEVHFVDYGNSMEIPSSDVKEITSELKSVPPFGIPCSLFAVKVPVTEWTQELIDEFLNLADGKSLEAHFVDKTGPVFELILTDPTESSSINEHFGATKDSLEAGISKKDKEKKFSQDLSKPVETQVEYAGSEDTYQIADIGADITETVSVGWFINPDQFYCQRNSCKSEFTSIVNEIQSAYKKRTPYKGDLHVGQPVIAQFPADKVLYRAEIIEIKGLKCQVQYVDYGNVELLAPCHLWQMEKRFLSLPKQGILCALKGVQPKELEWQKDSPEFEKYFGVDSIECTFHGLTNGKYSVSLAVNGQDVAKELVSCGLANEKVEEKAQPKEPLALHLLKGQQVLTHVTYIESVSKFFVHLDPVSAKNIQEKVEKHAESAKTLAPPTDLVEHQMCLATPDGTDWYRGKITDIPTADEVCIHFVDFGDSHTVPLNQVRLLPDSLLGYRPQATECMVFGSDVSERNDESVEETFKVEVEDQDVIIRIEEIKNERLVVHLFDVEGHCLELLKNVDVSTPLDVEALCPMPILTNTEPMWVAHIDGTKALWLQKESEADILSGLLELLFTFYEEEVKGVDFEAPVEGQLCAAKSKDGSWYRGRIGTISDDQITVHYIDFGNSETLAKSEVKELDPSFSRIHALSVCAYLPLKVENTEGFSSELETVTSDTLFDVSFAKNEDDCWYVHLENNDLNLVYHLSGSGLSTEIQPLLFRSGSVSIPDDEKIDIYISRYESPSEFWVQKDSDFVDILDLQENLQLIGSSQAGLSNNAVGSLCIAQFSDELWYRAQVLENDEKITKVFFLDYGNKYDVETASLKKLPVKFFRWPYYAVKCSLLDVSFLDSEEQLEKCSVVMSDTETVFQLQRLGEGDPVPVSLYLGEKDLPTVIRETEIPKEEDIVSRGEDNIQVVNEVKPVESSSVLVSHICSPAKFWIQYENISSELEKLADALVDAEGFEQILNPEVGTVCAALFEDDEQWYRAKVLELCDESFHVLFIDYGNSSIVCELRKLPDELVNMPPIAKCCRLQFPPGVESWSVDADKKFVDMSGEGSVIFQMEICCNEEPLEVKLILEGQNVSDIIGKLTPPVVPQDDKGSSVLISHINSPSDFWIQWESECEKLDSISEKLLEAENYESLETASNGIVCAAQFANDELWYRAKIISFVAQNIEVLFIDYGNSASVTEIRRLPEELLHIPALAVHCSFPLPKGCDNWSDQAAEEFFTIFGDGTNTYDLTVVHEGEPLVVSLKLNDVKVEEMLQKSCAELLADNLSCSNENSSSTDVEILTENEIIIDPNEPAKQDKEFVDGNDRNGETTLQLEKSLEDSQTVESEELLSAEIKCSEEKLVTLENPNLLCEKTVQKEDDEAQASSKQIENGMSSPKHSIEHKEEIIRDLKVELLVQEDSRKIGHVDRIVPGSISRGIAEELVESPEDLPESIDSNEVQNVLSVSDVDQNGSSEENMLAAPSEEEPCNSNTLTAEEHKEAEVETSKTPVEFSEACCDATLETDSHKKTLVSDSSEFLDNESMNVSNDLESSSASTTENINKTNGSNESQNSADAAGSLDDSSSSNSTIVDNDNQSTGLIDMSDTKSNYQIASLHKTEELYEASKSETKCVNVNDDSPSTPK